MFFASLFWREHDLQIYNRAQWLKQIIMLQNDHRQSLHVVKFGMKTQFKCLIMAEMIYNTSNF